MNKVSSILATCSLLLLVSATANAQTGDPTAAVIPGIECESATCEDAAAAFSQRNYVEAAQLFSSYFDQLAESDDGTAGAWLVHAAYAHQRAGEWDQAALLYARAADQVDMLRDYLLTQAAYATLQGAADPALLEVAQSSGALEAGFEGGFFLLAQIQARDTGLPTPETTAAALSRNDVDLVCPWLVEVLGQTTTHDARAALLDLAHGNCIDTDYDRALSALSYQPSATARLQRAQRLFRAVRFPDALAQLDAIGDGELSAVDQCRADFRRARSHFRMRQQQPAEAIYRRIVENCTDDANEDERVRSIYAVGNRNYHRGNLDESERYFTMLFEQYPERSHADDALFFLARIERRRDNPDRDRELALLHQALEEYPHEDMIHEMAWEVFEDVFRRGDYREFIDGVIALPLPDWDHQYFSQGRLEYFVGLAHSRLDETGGAERYWQLAWIKYPFSFYGYLAHLRLLEMDVEPEPLQGIGQTSRVTWFEENFDGTGADILARAGHLDGACDFETARLGTFDSSRADRWRLAALCHQAGRYHFSHNVARRQITGRPWSVPLAGRLVRWHVAWPDPYRSQLTAAVEQFGPQEPQLRIHPGFATSIMREESSFIEDIVSWAGALGLMQLMPGTARDHDSVIDGVATPDRLLTAEVNIPVAIDHINTLSRRFDGHPVLMTAAYNAGAGRINGWLRRQPDDEIALWVEDIPFLETRNYTKRVIGSYAAYQFLHGDETLDDRIVLPAR